MNLFFVFDEHTDALSGDSVRVLADISMDAIRKPTEARPKGEPIVGEITRFDHVRRVRISSIDGPVNFVEIWQGAPYLPFVSSLFLSPSTDTKNDIGGFVNIKFT